MRQIKRQRERERERESMFKTQKNTLRSIFKKAFRPLAFMGFGNANKPLDMAWQDQLLSNQHRDSMKDMAVSYSLLIML